PTFLVAWSRRLRQGWILIATLGMLIVQYSAERVFGDSATFREIWLVVGFAAFQYVLASSLIWLRRRFNTRWAFYSAVVLALLPFVAARLLPQVAPAYQVGFLG